MRTFTIRDIICEKILPCDDGDLILRHCTGDLLYLYKYRKCNSLPKKVEFNLRLSKETVKKMSE